MTQTASTSRFDVLEGAPLRYAPTTEVGALFLFAHLADRWRLRVEAVQSGYRECTAYQKTHGKEKRIRIEFEFHSCNFKTHGHDLNQCHSILSSEHDSLDAPANLQIVKHRREFGVGFSVWITPTGDPYKEQMERITSSELWTLPSQCHKGDLILCYFTLPEQSISHVLVAADRAKKVTVCARSDAGPIECNRVLAVSPRHHREANSDGGVETAKVCAGKHLGTQRRTGRWWLRRFAPNQTGNARPMLERGDRAMLVRCSTIPFGGEALVVGHSMRGL